MFHRGSRRGAWELGDTAAGHRPAAGHPGEGEVEDLRRDDLLACPEGAVRLVVAARLLHDHGQEVEGCLALEVLGWERAEGPARSLLDRMVRTVVGGRHAEAERAVRRAAARAAAQFQVEPEDMGAVASHSFERASEITGLRRDFLVLCAMAFAAELLRGESQEIPLPSSGADG
ncbi:MAG TPA: hypothetical protein VEI83_16335 [Acidimicrobiales bacterium]|nr:hypothetical protein [Acidimicrobiales bacterium]